MKKESISNRLAQNADLLTELQPLQSLLELYGNERLLIEHHNGICECRKERIVVSTRKNWIVVQGSNLCVVLMTKCRLVIQGDIHSVSLSKEL